MFTMRGIIPALITPFDENSELNTSAVPSLVQFLLDRKVGGLFIGGSSGEAFTMNPAERKQLAEAVVTEVAGAAPTVVHVAAMDIRVVEDLARHAAKIKADAVASVLPFYYSYNLDEIRAYFQMISAASSLPVIVYVLTQGPVSWSPRDFAEKVLSVDGVCGLKYTGVNPYMMWSFLQQAGDQVAGYVGDDKCLLPMLGSNATGAIGTNYSGYPEPFVECYESWMAGDVKGASAAYNRGLSLLHKLVNIPAIARIKCILRLRGVDVGGPRLPMQPIDSAAVDTIRNSLEEFGLL